MAEAIDTAKRTGGRPRLDESERRSHHVKVGFNGLDYDTVEYKAQQSGRNIPNYIHDAALGATVRGHISDEQVELVRNVAAMGNNLNQLARKANAAGFAAIRAMCERLINELSLLIRRIVRGGDITR